MYKRLNESERNRPEISINGWKRERKRERRGEENVKKRNKKGDAWEIQKQERLWGNENSSKQEREKRFEIDAKNIEKKDETWNDIHRTSQKTIIFLTI